MTGKRPSPKEGNLPRRRAAAGLLLWLVALASACDDKDHGPAIPSPDGKVMGDVSAPDLRPPDTRPPDITLTDAAVGETSAPSFGALVQPILTLYCAKSGCHAGSAPPLGIDLSSGKAHKSLVNVTSSQCPAKMLVWPGAIYKSYIMDKLSAQSFGCFTGKQMPPTGPLLSVDVKTISDWIAGGAPNN